MARKAYTQQVRLLVGCLPSIAKFDVCALKGGTATTSKLIARLVPYGMVLDPDGKMDVFTFSNERGSVHHVGTVTPEDSEDYVLRKVVGRVPGWKGGTTYSYVLEHNLQHFGWLPAEENFGGLLSRFFGVQRDSPVADQKRSVVVFVTDGENDPADHARMISVLETSERRGDKSTFYLWVPVSMTSISSSFGPSPRGSRTLAS
ncbi:hypothetical protein [Devosia limi]|uniref:VWFA domain-containing protein n=1 Tax=Devosia limi DSM 17137 TaxID=1121477 RepID=A0A1M5CGS1_9HYPH|nr:hypothetical protein [Devosia limi]SHF53963.1 hypothetical protein SAMN02745223_02911 [Devosia limi DSM 17137]